MNTMKLIAMSALAALALSACGGGGGGAGLVPAMPEAPAAAVLGDGGPSCNLAGCILRAPDFLEKYAASWCPGERRSDSGLCRWPVVAVLGQ